MNELHQNQARRALFEQLSMLAHDHGADHGLWVVRARQSGIEGLEVEIKAVGAKFAELRDKVREAGPERIYDPDHPRRRHKNTK